MYKNPIRLLLVFAVLLALDWQPVQAADCRVFLAPQEARTIGGQAVRTVSATATEDLRFAVRVPMRFVEGEHRVMLRLRMPGEFLYQEIEYPVSANATVGRQASKRRVPGYPFPMESLEVKGAQGVTEGSPRPWVEIKVPLAGTSIIQSSLYGVWSVEAFLDGEVDESCGQLFRFKITE